VVVRSIPGLIVATMMSGAAMAGGFQLRFEDNSIDRYDSRLGRFERTTCRDKNDVVTYSMDTRSIQRLKKRVREVRFFELPERLERNHSDDGELTVLSVCGGCPESRLSIELGFRRHTVEWECKCDDSEGDPPELAPLLQELRDILRAQPAIAGLSASSCAFY
jgi:hypothetical protein